MKKTKFCFIIILSFFVITLIIGTSYGYLNPKDTISGNSAYSEAIKIVQEVMKAYYIRGPYIQYNYAKTKYGIETPEDATSQKTKYDVCASFMYDVYTEAFGMHHDLDKFPRYNTEVLSEARNYYNNKAKRDGRFLVYYEKGSEKYVLGNSSKYSNFVKKIQPGDIFVYTGHVLVAYDVVKNPNTNQYDVLLLNSTQGPYIMTRITSTTTSRLSYNIFKSKYGNNNVLDIDREGTIQWKWLSTDENFVKDGTLTCKKEECAVIRPFYKTDENKVAFNYRFKESNYKKSKLRVEYPGLLIEKTVDANDNNSVYIGDKLTYTIKITNKSNVSYQEKNYQPFNIEETLGDYVKYVSSTKNGKIKNKTITWQIDKLLPNQSVDLKYTVEVINNVKNVSKVIQADGKFYSKNNTSVSISTGNVKNPIIPKVSKVNNSYQNCYDNNKNKYTGLNLINEIYKCVSTINYNFDKFKFEDIISKKAFATSSGVSDVVSLKNNQNDNAKQFSKMILNNYWSGIGEYKSSEIDYFLNLPRWNGNSAILRARTINSRDFREGDVLIYSTDYSKTPKKDIHTNENGIYAFIYLDGKFVGNNYSNEHSRNEFTYKYYSDISLDLTKHFYSKYSSVSSLNEELEFINYQTLFEKDYYVILRPEKIMKEIYKIVVSKLPTKVNYVEKEELLDLTGGKLEISYNDGTSNVLDLSDENINVTGYDNSKVGKNIITVLYDNKKTTFEVNLESKKISKIEITTTPKKYNYIINKESLDLSGGILTIVYEDGSKDELKLTENNITVTGFDNSRIGKNTITVQYNGIETSFEVEIVEEKRINIVEENNPYAYLIIGIIIIIMLGCLTLSNLKKNEN